MDFFTEKDMDFFGEMVRAMQVRVAAATRRAVIDVLVVRMPGEVRAVLKALIAEESAARGLALGPQAVRESRNPKPAPLPPMVAPERIIPAEYEYDPSLDSYRRGVVYTVRGDAKVEHYITVTPGRVAVIRNETPGPLSITTAQV